MPVVSQSGDIVRRNLRLLNCWLGIATREHIGATFCVECEYIEDCKNLYFLLSDNRQLHPASLARRTMNKFSIESEYLSNGKGEA